MTERFNCEIETKAKFLARQKGLDPRVVMCPFNKVCNGSLCAFDIAPVEEIKPVQVDKFINKIKAHEEKVNGKESVDFKEEDLLKDSHYTDYYKLVGS